MFRILHCKAHTIILPAAFMLLALFPGRASAMLKPEEVVVVVNSSIPYSVALGKFYMDTRKLPEANLVELELPRTSEMSALEYENMLVKPLRAALASKGLTDSAQCLLLMYGVPYRLSAGPMPSALAFVSQWSEKASVASLAHMQRNIQLMGRVGRFPEQATAQTPLDELENLFGDLPELTLAKETGADLTQNFAAVARQKVQEIRRMEPEKAAIAIRQVIALYVNAYGLDAWNMLVGLLGELSPPVPGTLPEQRDKLTQSSQRLLDKGGISPAMVNELLEVTLKLSGQAGVFRLAQNAIKQIDNRLGDSRAAVDSELALLFWDSYDHESKLDNPLRWTNLPKLDVIQRERGRVLMVSRLDGPGVGSVMKMIQFSQQAEQAGLEGTIYLDYGGADLKTFNFRYSELVKFLEKHTTINVVKEESMMLFKPGECPDTAIYLGYSNPHHFINSCSFVPGAIAFHLGNNEAQYLRDPKSTGWVPNLIANGASVVIGDVFDSNFGGYVQGFEFVPMLLSGRVTVCEAYWRCVLHVSWRMILIADPLYNPYGKNPQTMPLPEGFLPR